MRFPIAPVALVLSFGLACGGSEVSEPSESADQSAGAESPPSEPQGPPPAAQAQPGGDVTLAADLNAMCETVTEAMRDRSKPLPLRMREMEHTFRASDEARYRRVDQLIDDLPHDEQRVYENLVAAVAERGVRLECEPLQRMFALRAAGDNDLDPTLFAPMEEDLAAMCSVVTNFDFDEYPPDQRMMRLAMKIEQTITHPSLRLAFEALAAAETVHRYPMIQLAAEEEGVHGWTCPALEALWPSEP